MNEETVNTNRQKYHPTEFLPSTMAFYPLEVGKQKSKRKIIFLFLNFSVDELCFDVSNHMFKFHIVWVCKESIWRKKYVLGVFLTDVVESRKKKFSSYNEKFFREIS